MSDRQYRRDLDDHRAGASPTSVTPAPGRATLTSRFVDRAAQSSGSELPEDVRGRFESSLGTDLSAVRVHTGDASQEAAQALGARAYATGNDVHFNAGQYDPTSADGMVLIAHEVAHTVQQRGGAGTLQCKPEDPSPGDPYELDADRTADAMVQAAPTAAGPTVKTTWTINYSNEWRGGGGALLARNDKDALYCDGIVIQPDADGAKVAPPIKVAGVALAPVGASVIGTYPHPRDKGGTVSAQIATGTRPTYDFTLGSPPAGDVTAARIASGDLHKQVVERLGSLLDEFVEPAEAQEKLNQAVAEIYDPYADVPPAFEATIRFTGRRTGPAAQMEPVTYPVVNGDTTFKLRVSMPEEKAGGSETRSTTTSGGVRVNNGESQQRSQETGQSVKTSVEREIIREIEQAYQQALEELTQKISGWNVTSEREVSSSKQIGSGNKSKVEIKGGKVEGSVGLSTADIPLLGGLVGDLFSAKLSFKADLNTGIEITASRTDKDAQATRTIAANRGEVLQGLTSRVQTSGRTELIQKVRESAEQSVFEKVTSTAGTSSGVESTTRTTSGTTTTRGTVLPVAGTSKPVLSVDK